MRPPGRSGETAEPPVADAARERPSAAAKDPEAPSFGRTLARSEWADLDVLYATCTSPEPERRYRTVDALIRDIDHFLGGEPLEARPDTMGYRLKKFVRRNRRAVTAALASVAFVTLLIAFYTWRLANARTEAVAEAARTRRVERFMMDLFQGGDTEASPADSLRVLTLVDRGLAEARALDQEPAIQADMFETLGNVYRGLGRLERADTLLLGALRLRRNLLPDDDPDVGRSQIALGNLRADQAAYEEAERMIREGLATVSHRDRPDHADVIFGMTSLARVFELQGRYGEAIAMLEDVARRLEGNEGARAELAQALYGLANNHFYAGHYQTADSLNRIVLPMSRAIYGDRHPNVASDLINLGAVQQELGNYQEAERFQREALEIVRAWYGPDHPETAASLTMVGRALWYQGRSDEAVGMLREALAVQERVYGPVHPRIASTLNEIAGIAYQRDRYDEAEAAYRRIIDIYRAVYPGGHYYIGIALANLAGVYQGRRQHRQAEALYREALAIYEKTLDAGNVNIGIGHIKLGRSLLRQGRFGEAVTETRKGYEMLIAQANPAVSFLRAARLDLVAGYDSLGRTADADRFRRELADSATAKAP
ncbi:MAG: tetratricopeptide repeat protein [Gemmatimonadales bacterium]